MCFVLLLLGLVWFCFVWGFLGEVFRFCFVLLAVVMGSVCCFFVSLFHENSCISLLYSSKIRRDTIKLPWVAENQPFTSLDIELLAKGTESIVSLF